MTTLTTSATLSETQAREEICRVGKSLFDRGYVHATAGNISVRLDKGFLITPTDACLGFLDPAKLSLLDAHGHHVSGDKPSKTIALHRRIYDASVAFDTQTRCVIHTHSTPINHYPLVNGQSIGPLAYKLNHQDVIKVADVKISFLMTA